MNEQLKIIISAEVNKLKKSVDDAKSKVGSFKEEVAKASKNVDENFKNMGTSIANGAKAFATGLAVTGGALLALGASTQEYRNEQAKLTTAFETAGSSAEQAKTTYNDLFRVMGDSGAATEAAQSLSRLTTEEQALSEWTTICQGIYATFGDGMPIETLAEAAAETAAVGTITGDLSRALVEAGIDEDAFNEKLKACNDEAEREKLIRDTLNGVYSDAAAKYEENNEQVLKQNEAQGKLQDTLATLGEAVAPIITAFTNLANDALAVVVPYIQQLAETYGPALSDALSVVSDTLSTIFGYLVDNWDIVLTVAGVIAGIAAAIGLYNAVAAVKAAMAALEVTTVWGLVTAYAAQAAAMIVAIAPYLLIVAAIAAVIAIIVLCVKHWDKIKEAVAKAWDWIKQKTQQAVESVVGWFVRMKQQIELKIFMIKQAVSDKFNEIKQGISDKMQAAKDSVVEIFTNIKTSITDKINGAKTAVLNTFDNLKNGIKTKLETAKSTVKNIIDAIKGFFSFKFSWPKIPMPHFGISPSGWKVGDLLKGSIPKLSINWYAEGGVFDKPTLFSGNGVLSGLGEAGAEAVVPLENNLGWLDKLAGMLQERMGGTTPIVLEVDGRVFAQTAINTINQQTRQTGKLALNLV